MDLCQHYYLMKAIHKHPYLQKKKDSTNPISYRPIVLTSCTCDLNAPFSIAPTPRCKIGCNPIPWIAPLYP